jgi:GAF domain-containing protein
MARSTLVPSRPDSGPGWGRIFQEATASRLGRAARLTAGDVRRRRAQLSAIGFVLLLALIAVSVLLTVGPIVGPSWLPSASMLHIATVLLAVGFAAYTVEKEFHLRRLSRMLNEQHGITVALAHRVGDLEPLARMEKGAAAAKGPGDVLTVVLAEAIRQGRWSSGAIYVTDGPQQLRVICTSGSDFEVESVADAGRGPLARAHREPVLISRDADRGPSLFLPMVNGERFVGVLALSAPSDRTFSEDDQAVLALFAECAAAWVDGAVASVRPSSPATSSS